MSIRFADLKNIFHFHNGNSLDQCYKQALHDYLPAIEAMNKLVALYHAGNQIYVKITTGARAGSIARLNPGRVKLKTVSDKQVSDDETRGGFSIQVLSTYSDPSRPNLIAKAYRRTDSLFGSRMTQVCVGFKELIEIERSSDLPYFDFDGRNSVKANYDDVGYMEILPDYTGPTVFVFNRATSKSAADKAAEKKAKLSEMAYTPIDMFGNKLAAGDLFIYSRRDELIIAKLLRVSASGYIVGKLIVEGREVSLQGEYSIGQTKNNRVNRALMKFDKNEILSQKLMMEKLKN